MVLVAAPVFGQTASFEVASIRPYVIGQRLQNPPGLTFSGNRMMGGGESLRSLISVAYGYDLQPFRVTGGAGWMDTEFFEIAAKTRSEEPLTRENARPLLQALLRDRFHLKIHRETREVAVYALVVGGRGVKAGLKLSASDARFAIDQRGSEGALTQLNVTNSPLATFVAVITGPGFAGRPVIDKTGLSGNYDFVLKFTSRINSDSDAPLFFTAVEEELGLKLEAMKAPFELLVIDRAEKPSPN
ncbi:MAG TPA: TIGR03435 family protein [Bryobacteraceae bacterium]